MKNKYEKYIIVEKLLNSFFKKIDFCKINCVQKWKNIWCCNKSYYNDFNIDFNYRRSKLYWTPSKNVSNECWYHSENWCILKTMKSPICLWFLCTPYINYLKELWIIWNWNELINILWDLINQDFTKYDYIVDKINWYIYIVNLK